MISGVGEERTGVGIGAETEMTAATGAVAEAGALVFFSADFFFPIAIGAGAGVGAVTGTATITGAEIGADATAVTTGVVLMAAVDEIGEAADVIVVLTVAKAAGK
jgi:hypothetical protein